jgi:hypothetical protein
LLAPRYGAGRFRWYGYLPAATHQRASYGFPGRRYGRGALRYGYYGAVPGTPYLWIPGTWCWRSRSYAWTPGAWTMPPRAGDVWVPGHWVWTNDAWSWEDGSWSAGPPDPADEPVGPPIPGAPDTEDAIGDDGDASLEDPPSFAPPAPPPLRSEDIPAPPLFLAPESGGPSTE